MRESSARWNPGDYRLAQDAVGVPTRLKSVVYVHPTRIHLGQADHIQILETLVALAQKGVESHLACRGLQKTDRGEEDTSEASFEQLIETAGRRRPPLLNWHPFPPLGKDRALRHRFFHRRSFRQWLHQTLVGVSGSFLYLRSARSTALTHEVVRARRKSSVPYVFEVHALAHKDPDAERLSRAEAAETRDRERALIAHASGLVANGPLTAEDIRSFVPKCAPIAVIPNGATPFEGSDSDSDPDPVSHPESDFVYVGSLQPWKGVEVILEALSRLETGHLAVVGGGDSAYSERLRSLCQSLGLADRVRFVGPASRRGALAHLSGAKVALVPLARDGLSAQRYTCPIKLLEAMGHGVPVIVADRPSVRALLSGLPEGSSSPDSVVLWDSFDDPARLATAMGGLLEDSARRETMMKAGLELGSRFTWERRAARIVQFLEFCL